MRKWLVASAALGVAVIPVIYGPRFAAFLRIGTTFAAQQTCACLHLAGRTLESCTAELGRAGRLVKVETDGPTVRASALFGAFSGEARDEPPFGCHPVK
nr:hypothetical protein Hi04_10k_c3807_00011 [uncultured bacterium]